MTLLAGLAGGGSPREVVNTNANTDQYAGHVVGGGAIEKAISLLSNTEYQFSAYAKVITGTLNLGAKTATGTEMVLGTTVQAVNNGYEKVTLNFNTGSEDNIKLYLYAQNGSEFYVDDIMLQQINPAPAPIDNTPAEIYSENLVVKSQALNDEQLALAFLYQINQDRDAEVIIYEDNQMLTRKKVSLKAGYGHYLTELDLTAQASLVAPTFEINLLAVDDVTVLSSTGKIALTAPAAPIDIIPTITASTQTLVKRIFTEDEAEQIVLKTTLTSDEAGAQLHSLTFKASGDIDDKTDIKAVKIYHDNNNGQAEVAELLGSGEYSADNGSITFELATGLSLPVGTTRLLLAYSF